MISNLPKVTFVFDRRKKSSLTVKSSVELRITYNYRQIYISTGIMLYSNQWKNNTITNCPDILQISETLDKILIQVRKIILNMAENNHIDITLIPRELELIKSGNVSFYAFIKERSNIRKYGKSKDSQKRYDRFIKFFKAWGKIKRFEDITDNNIIEYDNYLTNKKLKTYSKWNNYHRFLNSFILDAIEAGYIQRNPYKWINIDKGKTFGNNKYLTPEEFQKLKRAKMPTESLERVKDLFIFQTYTCLSYYDLKTFDAKNIEKIKDTLVYTGNRQKTDKPFTIPLLPEALDILKKYNNKLPVISNVKYNEYIKLVAQAAGIDKPVTTHWARHTGATLLLNNGVDIHIVSKICGHSSIKMTEQIYAKLLDETVVDAVNKIKI